MGEFLTSLAQGAATLDRDIRAKLKQDPGTLGRMASTVLFDTTPMDQRIEGETNAVDPKIGGAMTRRDFLKLAGTVVGGAVAIKASELLTACTTAPEVSPAATPEIPTAPLSPTLTPAIRPSRVPSSEVAKQLTGMLITENPSFPALVKDFDTWSSQHSKNVTPSDAKAFGFLIENYRSTGDKTKDNILFPYVVSTGRVGADGKPASADFYAWEGNKEFAKLTGRAVDFLKSPEQISGVLSGFQGTVIVWERNGEKGNVDFWTEPNGTYIMYITPDGRNVKVDLPKDGKIAGLALLAKPTEVPTTLPPEPTATEKPVVIDPHYWESLWQTRGVIPDKELWRFAQDQSKIIQPWSAKPLVEVGEYPFMPTQYSERIGEKWLAAVNFGCFRRIPDNPVPGVAEWRLWVIGFPSKTGVMNYMVRDLSGYIYQMGPIPSGKIDGEQPNAFPQKNIAPPQMCDLLERNIGKRMIIPMNTRANNRDDAEFVPFMQQFLDAMAVGKVANSSTTKLQNGSILKWMPLVGQVFFADGFQ